MCLTSHGFPIVCGLKALKIEEVEVIREVETVKEVETIKEVEVIREKTNIRIHIPEVVQPSKSVEYSTPDYSVSAQVVDEVLIVDIVGDVDPSDISVSDGQDTTVVETDTGVVVETKPITQHPIVTIIPPPEVVPEQPVIQPPPVATSPL